MPHRATGKAPAGSGNKKGMRGKHGGSLYWGFRRKGQVGQGKPFRIG